MDQEKVIVIDFGGQYNQLVARRVRECNVYCEIYSYKTDLAQIKAMNPKGIILTGGPNSCYEDGAPTCTKELFELSIGKAAREALGYYVGEGCIGCKLCYSVCPQKCIDITKKPVVIDQHHCLHCGRCAETCPKQVIEKRG